eukprot:NODE_163_length_16507_cov_1.031814.p14 type:complete len:108 gc:universal NODE_163_length_16507_cov_1.031814:2931-2608(-)
MVSKSVICLLSCLFNPSGESSITLISWEFNCISNLLISASFCSIKSCKSFNFISTVFDFSECNFFNFSDKPNTGLASSSSSFSMLCSSTISYSSVKVFNCRCSSWFW